MYTNMQNLCDRTNFKPYYTAQVPYFDTSLLIMVAGLHIELQSIFLYKFSSITLVHKLVV